MTNAPTMLSHCCSNLRYSARYRHDLEATENARSGELTSRLLAWRSRDRHHRPTVLQVSRYRAPGRSIDANLGACRADLFGRWRRPAFQLAENSTRLNAI
ncbi:hypothetical protein HN011_011309 [Eciton burchellii]|nr:hypothetical protein HN011_011309 [Eciton burchellii]